MDILVMELDLIEKDFFHILLEELVKDAIIFRVDMSSSTNIDDRKKGILFLGKGPTQGLEHIVSAEKMYSINFSEKNKKNLFKLALQQRK